MKIKDDPDGRYIRVGYSKRVDDKINMPACIIEHEPEWDDEDLIDWIVQNNDDADDIQITSIG